jgi:CDP-glucose 4,6-dehydratase
VTGLGDAFRGFFGGKRVLVTGHTGLKGSWLTLWLREVGARVVGLSLPPGSPLSGSIAGLRERINREVLM